MKKRMYLFSLILLLSAVSTAKESANSLQASIDSLVDYKTKKKIITSENHFKAIVLFNYLSGCPIVKKYLPLLKELSQKYKKEVIFINIDSSREASKQFHNTFKELNKSNNSFPFVIDDQSKLAFKLKMTTASEIAVINMRDYALIYKGAIDDRINLSFDRPMAEHKYLENILESLSTGKQVQYFETEPQGCLINLYNNI